MTELQQNRYDQLLRRVGDLKGPGSKVNDVLSELFPVFDVENMPAELLFLAGTRTGFGSASVAGVAAQISEIQLFNPAGSGKLITCTSFWATVATPSLADQSIIFGVQTAALPINTGLAFLRDTRAPPTANATAQIRTESGGVGSAMGRLDLSGNRSFHMTDKNGVCVLAPATGLAVATVTNDTTLRVMFFWRERVAEPAELNF